MDALSGLIVIVGVGLGSYLIRAIPFFIGRKFRFPSAMLNWLIYISLGITAGLVSKSLFIRDSQISFDNLVINITAITVAGLMQFKWGNTLLSLGAGILAAVFLKYKGPVF